MKLDLYEVSWGWGRGRQEKSADKDVGVALCERGSMFYSAAQF